MEQQTQTQSVQKKVQPVQKQPMQIQKPMQQLTEQQQPGESKFYKKWWFWFILGFIGGVVCNYTYYLLFMQ